MQLSELSGPHRLLLLLLPVLVALTVHLLRLKPSLLRMALLYLLGALGGASVASGNLVDVALLLHPLGKALLALLELGVLVWGARPWRALRARSLPLADGQVSSAEMLVLPRRFAPLSWRLVRTVASAHALLQAYVYFGLSFVVAALAVAPVCLAAGLLVLWGVVCLADMALVHTHEYSFGLPPTQRSPPNAHTDHHHLD